MARVRIEFPAQQIIFSCEIPVRISDLNYGNHLGHDALVSILHESRARFLASLGKSELDIDGLAMMVVDLTVRYLSEAFFGQVLLIEISAGELRRRSCELLYRVTNTSSGKVVAVASTGIVLFDRQLAKVAGIPPSLQSTLTR